MKKYTHEEMVERALISTMTIEPKPKKPEGPKNTTTEQKASLGWLKFTVAFMAACVIGLLVNNQL